jgi:hypothetical protein
MFGVPTHCKLLLTRANLLWVLTSYRPTPLHGNLLFVTQLFTSTDCLMRLAALTWPNTLALWDYCKVSMQPSVEHLPKAFSFWLPSHKADQFFEGNHLYIYKSSTETYWLFGSYLSSHDQLFHGRQELWLGHDRTIPTWTWFITHRVPHGYTVGWNFPHRTRTRAHRNPLRVIPVPYRNSHGVKWNPRYQRYPWFFFYLSYSCF